MALSCHAFLIWRSVSSSSGRLRSTPRTSAPMYGCILWTVMALVRSATSDIVFFSRCMPGRPLIESLLGLLYQLRHPVHNRLRRSVNSADQRREIGAIPGLYVELLLFRIGEEVRVLHGSHEGIL